MISYVWYGAVSNAKAFEAAFFFAIYRNVLYHNQKTFEFELVGH